ncbi:MAG: hypothetical protein Q8838_02750, partial [Candidatus Phytoplasma australasiaticum]|nr:hypothetical protein [Candidatus Phytoplasma australasiaticum]
RNLLKIAPTQARLRDSEGNFQLIEIEKLKNCLVKVGIGLELRCQNVAKGCNVMPPICMLCKIIVYSILWAVIRLLWP